MFGNTREAILAAQKSTCRFQTTPPLPPLKAAITISQHWTIDRLVSKIHETILSEVEHSQFSALLQPPNPSHRLVLELSDGCRLPTTEPCSIIHLDQLLTIRLCARPQPQLRLGPLDYTFHRLAPQPHFPLLLPSINTHPHQPNHHLLDQWKSNTSGTPTPAGHQHLLTAHQEQSAPPEQGPSQLNRTSAFNPTPSGDDSYAPSIELFNPTYQEQRHERYAESVNHESGSQRPLSSPRRSISLPLDYSASHNLLLAPVPSRPQHDGAPEHQGNARLQTHQDYSSHREQALEFPYRSPSSSSEEPKPSTEELDQALCPPGSSGHEVPRVRSHIAGFRKSAYRHYLPSNSDASIDGHGSSSADDSEDSASFSRHTRRSKNKTASRRSHSRRVQIESPRPRRISARRSMDGPTKRRAASSRPKRKSAPVRLTPDSDDDDTVRQAATIREEVREGQVGDDNSPSTHASKSPPSSSHHQAEASASYRPRKNHIPQDVKVVIPFSPGLVSPAYLKRKRSLAGPSSKLSLGESIIPPSPTGHSVDNTSHSTNSANHNAQEDSLGLAKESVQSCDRNLNATFGPAKSLSPMKSCRPSKTRVLTKARSFSPAKTKRPEPNKPPPSLSAGRTARSVYQIYMDDTKFKAASAQGPLRIPCSSTSLNDHSSLRQLIERLNLDMQHSWKIIIGDKVWLSAASSLKRAQNCHGDHKKLGGLLDGRIVQIDWLASLKELGVFPTSHPVPDAEVKPLQIRVVRNWDL
ncbi:hypothetical protein PTTG_12016 [Puccinia triticina 1-1 BBBD Race 1]|uniref:Uncharacterized protein n=1 Tax=Puccinia triticina (isolate 1-1 / race 1 (BBBD)) TaxID=630390 RepID=A0A180GYN9_PUCT1|nr:hypothetical protein PTTG_12016 [Puccinia triticina 1-1 BBBD Race 1]